MYAPNIENKRNTFLKKLKTFIESKAVGHIILGGDFNDILTQHDTNTVHIPTNQINTQLIPQKLL